MAFIEDDASGTVSEIVLACRHKMRCRLWNLPALPVHLLGLDTSDSILIPKTLTEAIGLLPWFSRFE